MTVFHVEGTKSSPRIYFDPASRVLEISGESYPENCQRTYAPMFQWLQEYFNEQPQGLVTLNMEIRYFNSSSSRTFMNLFDLLDEQAAQGRPIEVNWRFHEENETARECGEEFMADVRDLCFTLTPIADQSAG